MATEQEMARLKRIEELDAKLRLARLVFAASIGDLYASKGFQRAVNEVEALMNKMQDTEACAPNEFMVALMVTAANLGLADDITSGDISRESVNALSHFFGCVTESIANAHAAQVKAQTKAQA